MEGDQPQPRLAYQLTEGDTPRFLDALKYLEEPPLDPAVADRWFDHVFESVFECQADMARQLHCGASFVA